MKKEFTLTITCNDKGEVTLRDDRNGSEFKGRGMLLHLGDHWEMKSHNLAWGSGSSIVHAFMSGMIGARDDRGEDGDYYRYIYGHIAFNIGKETGNLRRRGIITADEAVEKYGKGGTAGMMLHIKDELDALHGMVVNWRKDYERHSEFSEFLEKCYAEVVAFREGIGP